MKQPGFNAKYEGFSSWLICFAFGLGLKPLKGSGSGMKAMGIEEV